VNELNIIDYFNNEIKNQIRDEIDNANGNEVFFLIEIDFDQEKIKNVEVLARGNQSMAPAIINSLPKNSMVLHNHPSGDTTPSGADIRVASKVGDKGIGFAISDNSVSELYFVVEPKDIGEVKEIDKEEILLYFKDDGPLANNMDGFEYRTEQLEIAANIVDNFNQSEFTLIEAGTGIGKSFA